MGATLFELGQPRSASDVASLDGAQEADAAALADNAEALMSTTQKVGEVAVQTAEAVMPVALAGGAILAASAAAWFFLGHHHVDVSVFIV